MPKQKMITIRITEEQHVRFKQAATKTRSSVNKFAIAAMEMLEKYPELMTATERLEESK